MDLTSYMLGKKAGGGGTPATLIDKNISANGTYNASSDEADGYKKVVVDVEPNLQNKSVTISTNTTTTIEKDNGYDGLGTVSVTTNIPIPVSRDWTQIGFNSEPEYIQDGFDKAKYVYDNWNPSQHITDFSSNFYKNLTYFPDIDLSYAASVSLQLYSLTKIKLTHLNLLTNMEYFLQTSPNLIEAEINNTGIVTTMKWAFYSMRGLKKVDLSNVKISSNCDLERIFFNDTTLAYIDISSMDFANFTGNKNDAFYNTSVYCLQSEGAYADGLPYVYVKDATAQSWVITTANSQGRSWTTDNVVIKNAS